MTLLISVDEPVRQRNHPGSTSLPSSTAADQLRITPGSSQYWFRHRFLTFGTVLAASVRTLILNYAGIVIMHDGTRETDAFAAILEPHLERLYRLAYRLTGNQSDAQDLVQDVLVKLYERRDELTSIADLEPWLCRVLYNRFIDDARKHARRRLTAIDPSDLEYSHQDCDCDRARPDRVAEQSFDISAVQNGLAALSIEHRTVLLMHDAEGYKLEEIQTITGVAIGTLKSRLHRARARLRGLLEADGTF
jgi:RNA polymerase sigma factor (sigma-70 family)